VAPSQFVFNSVFNLNGLIDVVVFRLVRQGLLLFDPLVKKSPEYDGMPEENGKEDLADNGNEDQGALPPDSANPLADLGVGAAQAGQDSSVDHGSHADQDQDLPLVSRSTMRGKYVASYI
jgi:hypothetical protein